MTLTQAQFARHLGVKRSYVTGLKKTGRLVLTANGLVDVVASEARITATADPAKAAVAARHAQNRAGRQTLTVNPENTPKTTPESPMETRQDSQDSPEEPISTPDYQAARARKETANAHLAELDLQQKLRELVTRQAVIFAANDAATTIRVQLERLPNILAPQLAAESNVAEVRLILADAIESTLTELSEKLRDLEKAE